MTAQAAVTTSYTYDALGRIQRVDYGNGSVVVYTYDAAGNRTAVTYGGGANGPPIANPDSVNTNARTALTFDPRANDSDPDGDALTITALGTPGNGTATTNSGQSVTYTPSSAFPPTGSATATDSFSYTIDDGHGHPQSATVSVVVTNRAPSAANDSVSTNFATAKTFNPRGNDVDPEQDALRITAPTTTPVATAQNGTVAANGAGTKLTYTPDPAFTGTDTFSYTITDDHAHSVTATVTMTVTPQNQPPVANADVGAYNRFTANGEFVQPVITLNPTLNDTDPDGDALTVTAVTQGASGAVAFTASSVTYTYPSSVHSLTASDSFTYTVSDSHGHSATAAVSISITVTPQGT
jgi:YD repeat-containing protein